MNILDIFLLSIKNLSRRKIRSWLTILGVIIGISTIVALLSLSLGLENSIRTILDRLGRDTLYIYPDSGMYFGISSKPFDKSIVYLIEGLDSVEIAIPLSYYSTAVMYKEEVKPSTLVGIPVDKAAYMSNMGFEIEDGRGFTSSDNGKCNLILGNLIAKRAFKEEIVVGDSVIINGINCKVIGILKSTGSRYNDMSIVVPMKTMEEKFGYNYIDVIFVKAKDVDQAKEDIERILEKKRGKDFTVMTAEQTFQYFKQILGIVSTVIVAIAAVSLVVSSISIMNTMYMSILERFKEIGLLKAVGAKNSEILIIFLIESGLIGLIGGTIGTIFGFIGAKIIEIIAISSGYYMFKMYLDIKLVLFPIAFSFLMGVLSGILPAYQASKLDPVEALRYE